MNKFLVRTIAGALLFGSVIGGGTVLNQDAQAFYYKPCSHTSVTSVNAGVAFTAKISCTKGTYSHSHSVNGTSLPTMEYSSESITTINGSNKTVENIDGYAVAGLYYHKDTTKKYKKKGSSWSLSSTSKYGYKYGGHKCSECNYQRKATSIVVKSPCCKRTCRISALTGIVTPF